MPIIVPKRPLNPTTSFPIVQQPAHLLERHRFRHEEIDPTGESLGLVPARRQPRQSNDERWTVFDLGRLSLAIVFDLADRACGFEAVEHRHGDIW